MSVTNCQVCGFIYNEWAGDSKNGVPKGTSLYELAGSLCSRCGMQGERQLKEPVAAYAGMEADYYDQFAGKSGIQFFCDVVAGDDSDRHVLEVGIGTGRIAIELCRQGTRVTGIDTSKEMLKFAEKKSKALFRNRPALLELREMNVLQMELQESFSHIILPDGILQHFTGMSEQIALLQKVHSHLKDNGILAVDIILPPVSKEWNISHRKRLMNDQQLSLDVKGATSLTRQVYHYEAIFEKFVRGYSEARYRVERELSLLLPKELGLLLESYGFKVMEMVNNYQSRNLPGWSTSYLEDDRLQSDFKINENLRENAGQNIEPYKENVWQDGGYPLGGIIQENHAGNVEYWTLIARKA